MKLKLLMSSAVALALFGCGSHDAPVETSQTFASPDDAVSALVAAVESHDVPALRRLLGPGTDALLDSGDAVADRADRDSFLERYRARHTLVAGGPNDLVLQVGEDAWPMPIPLVLANGKWSFDGVAGADEILLRRIGANELRTIDVMRGFVEAQREYAAVGHDGGAPGSYAQKLRSEPGKQDGLYWEVAAGASPSPAGPFLAAAAAEGYGGEKGAPYHGYRYRILTAQGDSANGGKHDYLVDGKLKGGFALLAWPDRYGVSGIMSFIVNQDGVVWQRDLGEDTATLVAAIQAFDPNRDWTPLAPEAT
jgi:Protein of unknown function (DUF2950)